MPCFYTSFLTPPQRRRARSEDEAQGRNTRARLDPNAENRAAGAAAARAACPAQRPDYRVVSVAGRRINITTLHEPTPFSNMVSVGAPDFETLAVGEGQFTVINRITGATHLVDDPERAHFNGALVYNFVRPKYSYDCSCIADCPCTFDEDDFCECALDENDRCLCTLCQLALCHST